MTTSAKAHGHNICEMHVAAPGNVGSRAMLRLLADAGRHQGLSPISMTSSTDPQKVRPADQTEHATLRFSAATPSCLTAIMEPALVNLSHSGFLLVNSARPIDSESACSIDADGIARSLGIPAYLPMVGAMARAAGWTDLDRLKAVVRIAMEDTAPYWVGPALQGVEAGFQALDMGSRAVA